MDKYTLRKKDNLYIGEDHINGIKIVFVEDCITESPEVTITGKGRIKEDLSGGVTPEYISHSIRLLSEWIQKELDNR